MKLFIVCSFIINIFNVPFIVAGPPNWRVGHTYPQPLPQDIMVDAVNYIGLILLHAHNQHNENNIAFSPYGITSVLVALGEGTQGVALDEILRATLLPLDVSITRVGLRDVHRHLKSYFIPQEGFLAGLTFSHENVTLRSSYQDILKFYGYDVNAFNNALYPDPNTPTTTASSPTQPIPAITLDNQNGFSTLMPTTTLTSTITTTESTTTVSEITETTRIETTTPNVPTITTTMETTVTEPATTTTETPTSTIETTSTPTTTAISSTTLQPTTTPTVPITSTTTTDQDTTTNIPQTTAEESRPTAITIDVVPSTTGDTTPTNTEPPTTTTIRILNTAPIIINVEPTTLSNSNTETTTQETGSTATDSTVNTDPSTTSDSSDTTTTSNPRAETTATTITDSQTTTPSNSDDDSTTVTTDSNPSTTTVTSTTQTETTAVCDICTTETTTQETAITVNVEPTTRSPQNGETTTTNEDTTERPTPTLITTLGTDLPTGFEIEVQPTTLASQNSELRDNKTTEADKNITVTRKPKKKSLPRFRDDADLMNLIKSQNKSEPMQNKPGGNRVGPTTNRSVISANTKVTSVRNQTEVLQSSFMLNTTSSSNEPKSITTEVNNLLSSTITTESIFTTNSPDINDEAVKETSNESDSSSSSEENMRTREKRSVIDYLIARYHDNNPTNSYMTSATEYEPAKPITFAVNGKIREPNINFMTYDTVLPFRYISHLNALALTFPLDSTRYYLLLLLPIDEMGVDNLISNMMSTTLKQIIYSLQPTRVKATIPSFMLKGYVVLTPTLQKLGIRQIFEPRRADFSRMTDDKNIYVTNIEQAVTVTIRNYVDPNTLQNDNPHFRRRGPVLFTADHPFLYFVMDSQIHVALMTGKIVNPLNSRIR